MFTQKGGANCCDWRSGAAIVFSHLGQKGFYFGLVIPGFCGETVRISFEVAHPPVIGGQGFVQIALIAVEQ